MIQDSNAVSLLKSEYASRLPAAPITTVQAIRHPVNPPSPELLDHLELEAVAAGVPANSVDWATLIPEIITDITTHNWLGFIAIGAQLAPAALSFVQNLISQFHNQPVPGPTPGPAINPGS